MKYFPKNFCIAKKDAMYLLYFFILDKETIVICYTHPIEDYLLSAKFIRIFQYVKIDLNSLQDFLESIVGSLSYGSS